MSTRSRMKGDRRRLEREAKRSAIAEQFGDPSLVKTSKPPLLGRALFLHRRDMKQFVGAGGVLPKTKGESEG